MTWTDGPPSSTARWRCWPSRACAGSPTEPSTPRPASRRAARRTTSAAAPPSSPGVCSGWSSGISRGRRGGGRRRAERRAGPARCPDRGAHDRRGSDGHGRAAAHLARYELSLAAVRDPALRVELVAGGDTIRRRGAALLARAGVTEPDEAAEELAAMLDGLVYTALVRGPQDADALAAWLRPTAGPAGERPAGPDEPGRLIIREQTEPCPPRYGPDDQRARPTTDHRAAIHAGCASIRPRRSARAADH